MPLGSRLGDREAVSANGCWGEGPTPCALGQGQASVRLAHSGTGTLKGVSSPDEDTVHGLLDSKNLPEPLARALLLLLQGPSTLSRSWRTLQVYQWAPPPRKGPLLPGVRGSLVPRVRQRQGGAEAKGGVPRCPHTCRDPSHLWKKGCLLPTLRHLSCLGPYAGNTGSPPGRSRQTGYASWSSPRQAEALGAPPAESQRLGV